MSESPPEPKTPDVPDYPTLNLAQAADFMGFSKRRLNQLRRRREIPATRAGWRGWRYQTADLMAYVERAAGVPETPPPTKEAEATSKPLPAWQVETIKIMQLFGSTNQTPPKPPQPEAEEAPIVRMVNAVLVNAIENGASDIHIEPDRTNLRVRIRVDGVMRQMMTMPKHIQRAVIARIEVMSDVPLYKHKSMHQGHIPIRHRDENYNIRVSVIPSLYGEHLVLHITKIANLTYEELGFTPEARGAVQYLIHELRGLLLLAGPSGSGLTTTATNLLQQMNSVTRTIVAYEELPERPIPGITNVYRWKMKGSTPATDVAAILRHDPDILFMGDLTNAALAQAAVDATHSGALVIATIGALDSVDALLRLVTYGIPADQVGRAVTGVLAQHLLPKICADCQGEGCDACNKSGKRGRIGVFEMRFTDKNVRDTLAKKITVAELRSLPLSEMWQEAKLLDDARAKAERGLVPTEAVDRLARLLPK